MLRSNLCDCSDAYIVVKGIITVTGDNNANTRKKKLTFRNYAAFRLCVSKINYRFIDNAENLDIVMSMDNLSEYSDNYSITSGSLWTYYRDEVNDNFNKIIANYKINNSKTAGSKLFEQKTKIIGSSPANINRLYTEIVVPLKYLSNFWRSLDLPLFKIELDLSWSRNCVETEILRTAEVAANQDANPPVQAVEETDKKCNILCIQH